jgi:hypothetical protein
VKFDLYDNAGEGVDSTGLFTDGAFPDVPGSIDLSGIEIDLHSGDVFQVSLAYDGTNLDVTITDATTNASASQSYPVDIPGLLGSSQGFVGFTAGTGGLAVKTNILNWTYSPSAPIAPASLTASVVDVLTVGLNWADCPHATGYEIQRMIAPGGTYATVSTVGATATSYSDPGLSTGTNYVYRVRALDAAGPSPWSNEAAVETPTLAATPRNPRVVSESDRSIDFAWDDESNNETGFRIYRKVTTSGTFQYLTTVPANTTEYVDSGLTPDTLYDYHIQAINLAGYSDFAGISTTTLPSSLPAIWSDSDVGTPALPGSAGYAAGAFTLTASGQEIGGTSDDFHFLDQPLRGDGTITARVVSMSATDPWAEAGVMIRQGLDAGSVNAISAITPGNGAILQERDQAGAITFEHGFTPVDSVTAPYWIRLTRIGDQFIGYSSPDGLNWTETSYETIRMGAEVDAGLALTSHNDAELNTAVFDHVLLQQADYSAGVAVASGFSNSIGSYLADRWYEGSSGTTFSTDQVDTSKVTDPAPQYFSQRSGGTTYTVPDLTPNGLYTVRLHEAELVATSAGARLFNVAINGVTVLTNFDIFAAAGGKDIAIAPAFATQADADGQIVVALSDGSAGHPTIADLEVLPRHATTSVAISTSASSSYGQAVTFGAVVSTTEQGLPDATGTIQFLVDGEMVGSGTVQAGGTATSGPITGISAGLHEVTVVYSGDGLYSVGTSHQASLNVARAALTITAADAVRTYGASLPSPVISAKGFVLGQGVSDLSGTLTETSNATQGGHVGHYALTPGGLTSANYAITYIPGVLSITPTPLSVVVDPESKTYGMPLPAISATFTGLVNGDSGASIADELALGASATARSHVGVYPITATGASPDYKVTFTPASLTITPASLTITANDATKRYGEKLPYLSARFDGLVPGRPPDDGLGDKSRRDLPDRAHLWRLARLRDHLSSRDPDRHVRSPDRDGGRREDHARVGRSSALGLVPRFREQRLGRERGVVADPEHRRDLLQPGGSIRDSRRERFGERLRGPHDRRIAHDRRAPVTGRDARTVAESVSISKSAADAQPFVAIGRDDRPGLGPVGGGRGPVSRHPRPPGELEGPGPMDFGPGHGPEHSKGRSPDLRPAGTSIARAEARGPARPARPGSQRRDCRRQRRAAG